ncbi:MAG: hypothetical protein K6A32_09580 [Bacteroidales bacterium]|nr:hypothetical protein [Bacteroidales bacterium]
MKPIISYNFCFRCVCRSIAATLAALFFSLPLASCYSDEGNYDYHALDVVVIDTTGTGIQPEYAIQRFDTLFLAPNVTFNGAQVLASDDAPLTYQWTIFSAVTGAGTSAVIDTLGHERVLQAPILRTGGNYLVQLVVTNQRDGIRQFFRVAVTVSEAFDGGWMVFYERADQPGTSDLALIFNPWTKNNVTTDRAYTNLYEKTNGAPIPGKPIRCFDIAMSLAANNYVGLCTDQTLVGVTEIAIEQSMAFSNFFNKAPERVAPTWYGHHGNGGVSGQCSEVLINDNKVYTNTYFNSASGDRESRFGIPKFDDGVGELAAWNAELPNQLNYGIIVYDQTNQSFRYAAFEQAQLEYFGPQNTTFAAFDVNHTGMQLLMGDWGVGEQRLQPYDYMLMAKGQERKLAVANFTTSTPEDAAIGVGLYEMTALCPQVAEATTLAASNVGSFVYYGAADKVYLFAYDSGLPATVAWQAPTADETVTCVRIMKYYNTVYAAGMMPSCDELVHIATWNEQQRSGHLYEYRINTASGDLDRTTSYSYAIPGRVKDMAWKYSMK